MESQLKDQFRAKFLKIERISKGNSDIFTKQLIIRNYISEVDKELQLLGNYPEGDTLRFLRDQAKNLLSAR